jgi:hypothetical protein
VTSIAVVLLPIACGQLKQVAVHPVVAELASGPNCTIDCELDIDEKQSSASVTCSFPVNISEVHWDFNLQYIRLGDQNETVEGKVMSLHIYTTHTPLPTIFEDKTVFLLNLQPLAICTFYTLHLKYECYNNPPCNR